MLDIGEDEKKSVDLRDPMMEFGGYRLPVPGVHGASDAQPPEGVDLERAQRQAMGASMPAVKTDNAEAPSMVAPDRMPSLNDVISPNRASPLPAQPAASRIPDLIQRRATAAQPIDAKDPKYRMGTGMRVLQTAGNLLSGFGGSHREPTYVGSGATNHQFDVDSSRQAKTVGNLDTEIGQTEKSEGDTRKMYEDAMKQAYESQLNESRAKTAEARGVAAEAQRTKAETDEAFKNSKVNPIDQRIKDADRMGLKGEDRKFYLANGKLKEGPGVSIINGRDEAKTVTVGDKVMQFNPRTQRYDIEVGPAKSPKSGTPTFKDKAAVDKYSQAEYSKQRAAVDREKSRAKSLNPDDGPEELQARYKDIEDKYQQWAQGFENEKKGYYDKLSGAPAQTPTAAAAAKTNPAAQQKQYQQYATNKKTGQRVGFDGKQWVDVTTGKPVN